MGQVQYRLLLPEWQRHYTRNLHKLINYSNKKKNNTCSLTWERGGTLLEEGRSTEIRILEIVLSKGKLFLVSYTQYTSTSEHPSDLGLWIAMLVGCSIGCATFS